MSVIFGVAMVRADQIVFSEDAVTKNKSGSYTLVGKVNQVEGKGAGVALLDVGSTPSVTLAFKLGDETRIDLSGGVEVFAVSGEHS